MKFTVLHAIPDCAEGGQLAKSRERDGGRGENISVADIMVNSDRVLAWLGATTVVQPASVGSQRP